MVFYSFCLLCSLLRLIWNSVIDRSTWRFSSIERLEISRLLRNPAWIQNCLVPRMLNADTASRFYFQSILNSRPNMLCWCCKLLEWCCYAILTWSHEAHSSRAQEWHASCKCSVLLLIYFLYTTLASSYVPTLRFVRFE